MEVNPTPREQAFIQQAIESDRLERPEAAIEEALPYGKNSSVAAPNCWPILKKLGHHLLTQGRGLVITSEEESRQFADDIKQRGLARISSVR